MYDAVVICRNADGSYQLAYDDGDEERAVPADLIFNADEGEVSIQTNSTPLSKQQSA